MTSMIWGYHYLRKPPYLQPWIIWVAKYSVIFVEKGVKCALLNPKRPRLARKIHHEPSMSAQVSLACICLPPHRFPNASFQTIPWIASSGPFHRCPNEKRRLPLDRENFSIYRRQNYLCSCNHCRWFAPEGSEVCFCSTRRYGGASPKGAFFHCDPPTLAVRQREWTPFQLLRISMISMVYIPMVSSQC